MTLDTKTIREFAQAWKDGPGGDTVRSEAVILLKCADEIERIRAANAAFSARNVELELEVRRVKDQRERLRAALDIVISSPHLSSNFHVHRNARYLLKETAE